MSETLERIANVSVLIHGGCRGAAVMAARIGHRLGWEVECFPADWDGLGRKAGPIRNQQMLDEGFPQVVLAFHNNLERSTGTLDMVKRARGIGVPTLVIRDPETSTS